MTPPVHGPSAMSSYERKRWAELEQHWGKKAKRRELLPPKVRGALESAGHATKEAASKAGQTIAETTPEWVKDIRSTLVDAALFPALNGAAHLLELLNEWIVELTDPKTVIRHHRDRGHDVQSIEDLKRLDLKHLDDFTRGKVLKWRTYGAGEGAGLGALAMIPVPVVGSVAAITVDMVAMQALSTAIATQICYAYGFDATHPEMSHMIDRMIGRVYRNQAPKAVTVKRASAAFDAAKGRVRWSQKLRDDHRLMAAVEKLLKQVSNGKHVPVSKARMGMPVVSVFIGAGTNAHVLGDVAKQARHYAATLFLAEKYGLELPTNLRRDIDPEDADDSAD